MKSLKDKKAANSSKKLKTVRSNLMYIRKTEKMLDKHLDDINSWIKEIQTEKNAQLKMKKALEAGDEVTFTVKDIDPNAETDDQDWDDNDFEEHEEEEHDEEEHEEEEDEDPENVIKKEMRKLEADLHRLQKKISTK